MIRLLPVGAALASVAVASTFALSGTMGSPAATSSPTPEPSATVALPVYTPSPATPIPDLFIPAIETPAPTTWSPPAGYTGTLKPNDWVQVTDAETCLNVRANPGLVYPGTQPPQDVPTLNCLPDGFTGQLSFYAGWEWTPGTMPIQADGYWWWNLLGQGWVAENWLTFLREDSESAFTARPDLAGTGLLAFSRADGVWLASPDDGSLRQLMPINTNVEGVSDIRWSPDGQQLAIGMWTGDGQTTLVVDLDGATLSEHPGLFQARWSPVGGWLAGLTSDPSGNPWSTPVVVELATDAVTPVGISGTAPEWSPDGSSVSFICTSSSWQEGQPDGNIIDRGFDCGGDGLHVVSLADLSMRLLWPIDNTDSSYFGRLSWSPDGSTIAVSGSGNVCQGHALIDVVTGERTGCLSLPSPVSFGGGCGGPGDAGESDWSPDGRILAYHWQFQEGQNGVALVDVATGDRNMILTTGASNVGYSSDGAHLVFESAGYVWTADADATNVTRMTDGFLPAWQPQP